MAKAAELTSRASSGARDLRQNLEDVEARVGRAVGEAGKVMRRLGAASTRVLSDMGGQVFAGQQIEREVIAPATADITGKLWNSPDTLAGSASVQEHERQHTIQGQQLGPFYLPSNLLGGGLALLRDRDDEKNRDWHGPSNWNERGPQQIPPAPWPRRAGR
jgi:hypothetical protein